MSPPKKRKKPVPLACRPTELGTGGAAGLAIFAALFFHLDREQMIALVGILGAVPGAITFVVELWRRR